MMWLNVNIIVLILKNKRIYQVPWPYKWKNQHQICYSTSNYNFYLTAPPSVTIIKAQ